MSEQGQGAKTYTLLGPDRQLHQSPTPGTLGGYQQGRLYGRLDCPAALRAIARGGYSKHRVFFADEQTAIAAGYRPCAACLPEQYTQWKARRNQEPGAGHTTRQGRSNHERFPEHPLVKPSTDSGS